MDAGGSHNSDNSLFKPPSMKPGGPNLRKQAVLAQQLHSVMDSVHEEAMQTSMQECSRLSLDNPSSLQQPNPSRRPVQLHSWDEYWDSKQLVDVPGRGSFNVYTAGSGSAVVFCLHGGGYTGLTWSLVARQLKDRYRVVAPDLRSHGETTTSNDLDFSAETMTADIVGIWQAMFGSSSSSRVPTLLVGHSMGGALAVWSGATKQISGLEGVVVIDVVEGTAIAALPHMMGVLHSRPVMFQSLQAAVDWAVRSGVCKNREMAGVSLVAQLVRSSAGEGGSEVWTWRTPLAASKQYWEGWYNGLSDAFLALPVPKMLLLAGTDRLDKSLTIGQMQGKFQLVLLPAAGHAIQEDEPLKTAEHLQQFLHRFRVGEPPMVIPRAPQGVTPVLPVVAGPLFEGSRSAAPTMPGSQPAQQQLPPPHH